MSSEVKANKWSPGTGVAGTLGDSGDTFTVPSGATLVVASGATVTNSGTATGFGGDNTPSFHASKSATQSLPSGTWTKVELDAEEWDSDSAFDSSTNYRFTVPSGEGGKYIFHFGSGVPLIDADQYFQLGLYKNGAQLGTFHLDYSPTSNKTLYFNSSFSANLSETDYIELYAKQNQADPHDLVTAYTYLSGFKLVGV